MAEKTMIADATKLNKKYKIIEIYLVKVLHCGIYVKITSEQIVKFL